jgi:hypothetical protein
LWNPSCQQAPAKPLNLQEIPAIRPYQQNSKQQTQSGAIKEPAKQSQVASPGGEEARPWSSLIDKSERDKMWNTGYSLNSKKVTETLGFVDMK